MARLVRKGEDKQLHCTKYPLAAGRPHPFLPLHVCNALQSRSSLGGVLEIGPVEKPGAAAAGDEGRGKRARQAPRSLRDFTVRHWFRCWPLAQLAAGGTPTVQAAWCCGAHQTRCRAGLLPGPLHRLHTQHAQHCSCPAQPPSSPAYEICPCTQICPCPAPAYPALLLPCTLPHEPTCPPKYPASYLPATRTVLPCRTGRTPARGSWR